MLYVQLQYDNGIKDESWREKMEWNVGEAYSVTAWVHKEKNKFHSRELTWRHEET